ncbi:MAG: ABC transporter ATP-binding protein [Acidimicrobiales bacterium]
MSALLEIRGLTVGYGWHFPPAVTAVRDVDLTVHAGEVVGVAGESGSGKSTLAFAATGLLDPPARVLSGSVRFDGDEVTTMSREELRQMHFQSASIVFQASMNVLNPVTRIEVQFRDAMAAHGVTSREEARQRAEEAFDLVKVPRRYLDVYPHQLSGGMRQRAVIALALVMRPKLLVLDEPTTALDVVVERAILQSLDELRRELGFGVIFITHDLSLLVEIADRIAIMYAGRLVEEAPARELYESPKHPYTIALMNAFPPLTGERERLTGIPGQPPDLRNLPPGCPYAPRCPSFMPGVCDVIDPPDVAIDEGHRVLCHLYGSVGATGV